MKLTGRSARLTAFFAALALAAGALLAAPATQAADYPPVIPVAQPATGTLYIGGVSVPVRIEPDPATGGIIIKGFGFQATLAAANTGGVLNDITYIGDVPVVLLKTDGEVNTGGEGLRPFTVVNLWFTDNTEDIVSSATNFNQYSIGKGSTKAGTIKLGQTTTNAKGAFDTTVPLPPGLKPGNYTITMTGIGPDGQAVALTTGVKVIADKASRTTTKVFFDSGSAELTTGAEMDLNRLIRRIPKGAVDVKVRVTGFVQPTASTANDEALSTRRAKNVAAYLKAGGLKGFYTVAGEGRATQSGANARRVEVVVTYTR